MVARRHHHFYQLPVDIELNINIFILEKRAEIADTEPDDDIREYDPEPYTMRTPDVQYPVCRRSARMHRLSQSEF